MIELLRHEVGISRLSFGAALAATLIFLLDSGVCRAGCPTERLKLDGRAEQAAEDFNRAGATSSCEKARELVKAEQMLSRFVEDYQVQCVLDPEIIEVQQRRVKNAKAARDLACNR